MKKNIVVPHRLPETAHRGYHAIFDYDHLLKEEYHTVNSLVKNVLSILDEVVQEAHLNEMGRHVSVFSDTDPVRPSANGFAIAIVIDESHLTAHCYSDLGILAVDIFTCGNLKNGRSASELFDKKIKKKYSKIRLRGSYYLDRF